MGKKLNNVIRDLEKATKVAIQDSRLMQGIPNDIARHEGYAAGLEAALNIAKWIKTGKPGE